MPVTEINLLGVIGLVNQKDATVRNRSRVGDLYCSEQTVAEHSVVGCVDDHGVFGDCQTVGFSE